MSAGDTGEHRPTTGQRTDGVGTPDTGDSRQFLVSTLDGLSAHIAVLDERGEILLTNKAYREFAERNEYDPSAVSEGANYLAVCDAASGEGSEEAKSFAEGIREVLSGRRPSFVLEYPCHSPNEQRWFIGRVTPLAGDGPRRVVVAHENVTERRQAEDGLIERLRIEALVADLAGRLVGVDAKEFEREIEHALQSICDCFDLDMGAIWLPSADDPDTMVLQHLHRRDDGPPLRDVMAERDCLPWALEHLRETGVTVAITDVTALPPEASRDPEAYAHFGATNSINVPLKDAAGALLGVLAFANNMGRSISKAAISRIEMLAHILLALLERARTEAALRESEERYGIIAEFSRTFTWETDTQGLFTFVGPVAERVIGYRPDELVGKTYFYEIAPAEDRDALKELALRSMSSGEYLLDFENRIITRDDRVVWVLSNAVPKRDKDGEIVGYRGWDVDITERKLAEEAFRESEETHRALVDGLPDVVMRYDREGRHLFVSDNVREAVGVEAAQFIGKTHAELGFPEALCRLWEEPIQRVFDSGVPFETEFSIEGKTGPVTFDWRLVPERDALGAVSSVLSISRDITERKRDEEALRQSEARFRTLFAESPVSISIHDKDTGAIVTANAAAYRAYGFTSLAELQANDFWLAPPYSCDDALAWIRKACSEGPQRFEWMSQRASGEVFRGHVHLAPMVIDDIERVMGTSIDITEHRQAEERLREHQEMVNAIVETSQDWIWAIDVDGTHTFSNQASQRILGLRPDEILGRTNMDLLHREDYANVQAMLPERIRDQRGWSNLLLRWRHKDGSYRFLESNAVPIVDGGGTLLGFRGVDRDITERKRAEEELNRINMLLSDAQRLAYLGAWELDLATGKTFWTDEVYAIHELDQGFDHNKVNGLEFYHPDDRPIIAQAIDETIATQTPYDLECRFITAKGNDRWVRTSGYAVLGEGRVTHLVGLFQDITVRKQAEETLVASEAKFKAAFMTGPDGFYWSTLAEGRFLEVNERFLAILGGSRDDFVGKTSLEIDLYANPDDRARVLAALKAHGSVRDIELQVRRLDGALLPVSLSISVVEQAGQQCILGIIRDITEHKRAEAEREALQDQLNQAQKMESVGRLAGGVAHDFNNMLLVILAHTDMALKAVSPTEPLHADLEEVHKAAQRSADLTRQLLAFARKQTVAPEVLDLNHTIERTLKLLRRLIGENIDLLWKPGHGLWPVMVDPTQVDQIVANLCVNARDAIGDVGTITIETGNIVFEQDDGKEHPEILPGEYTMLAVSDDGCGMDAETLTLLFEPFFTTKEPGRGTGLGLPMVYGAVRQNHGFIHVYSELGQGTTLRIYLPRHARKAAETKEPKPQATERGSETILLVEDEPAILRLVRLMLEQLGYSVLVAPTPDEAIRLAREHAGRIDLVMTDVVMPEMNGRDLAKNLLSIHPKMRRLFMSGYTSDVIAHHGVLDEGVHFIQKPFSMSDVATKVREALGT